MPYGFSLLAGRYGIAKLPAQAAIPAWCAALTGFVSVTRTEDELSIVCAAADMPDEVARDNGWCCLKLKGPFAFDQVGVLASFAAPLAERGVGIFAISTFDTDYILFKEAQQTSALEALKTAGHTHLETA